MIDLRVWVYTPYIQTCNCIILEFTKCFYLVVFYLNPIDFILYNSFLNSMYSEKYSHNTF